MLRVNIPWFVVILLLVHLWPLVHDVRVACSPYAPWNLLDHYTSSFPWIIIFNTFHKYSRHEHYQRRKLYWYLNKSQTVVILTIWVALTWEAAPETAYWQALFHCLGEHLVACYGLKIILWLFVRQCFLLRPCHRFDLSTSKVKQLITTVL